MSTAKAFFQALTAFLEYLALSYMDRREDWLKKQIHETANEIEKLRDIGDIDSHDRAAILLAEIDDRHEQLTALRARRNHLTRGPTSKDKAG